MTSVPNDAKRYEHLLNATIYKYFASHLKVIISSPFIVKDTMKIYTLLLAVMVVAISATVSKSNLNEVLTKAENEIHSNLMKKMMNGAKSSRTYGRKKFTAM